MYLYRTCGKMIKIFISKYDEEIKLFHYIFFISFSFLLSFAQFLSYAMRCWYGMEWNGGGIIIIICDEIEYKGTIFNSIHRIASHRLDIARTSQHITSRDDKNSFNFRNLYKTM